MSIANGVVDVAMQQRNPTISHRRTDSRQKRVSNTFQLKHLESPGLFTPRKRTTTSQDASEACEVVKMQKRIPTVRYRRTKRGPQEVSYRIPTSHLKSVRLCITRKPTVRSQSWIQRGWLVQLANRAADDEMQQRNPAIRHRRTKSGQKEPFDRIQSRQFQ